MYQVEYNHVLKIYLCFNERKNIYSNLFSFAGLHVGSRQKDCKFVIKDRIKRTRMKILTEQIKYWRKGDENACEGIEAMLWTIGPCVVGIPVSNN
jgi:hypothetical protein